MFSKHPLCELDTLWLGNIPSFTGTIEVADTSVRFVTAHTSAPTTPWRFHNRRKNIRMLTEHVEKMEGPLLLIGDLTAVPWNADIRHLRETAELYDSRTDLSPTFPSWAPGIRVPIDYIFHSDDLACVRFNTVKSTHSDHFGIVGEYAF